MNNDKYKKVSIGKGKEKRKKNLYLRKKSDLRLKVLLLNGADL